MQIPDFQAHDRLARHQAERQLLAPYAAYSEDAEPTRLYDESPHRYRTAFQRDRDRIIHARAFRRLKHKRQVFRTNIGDHYRTRLTHTMEVAQLSRTLARTLGLNEDLTEAIAIGHDLGHTPFGHLGESLLNDILRGKHGDRDGFPKGDLGGFKHNYQSLRIVDLLELKYAFAGLNLTAPVREGILKHTGLKRRAIRYPDIDTRGLNFEHDCAATIEGQVVAMADEVAQRTHDLEDGIRAGLVSLQEVRSIDIVRLVEERLNLQKILRDDAYLYQNRLINGLIDMLMTDLIETTLDRLQAHYRQSRQLQGFDRMLACFSSTVDPLQKQLNKFIYQRIIFTPAIGDADEVLRQVLLSLYQAYANHSELLPQQTTAGENVQPGDERWPRTICDHIAGMTDTFALGEFRRMQKSGFIEANLRLDKVEIDWMR